AAVGSLPSAAAAAQHSERWYATMTARMMGGHGLVWCGNAALVGGMQRAGYDIYGTADPEDQSIRLNQQLVCQPIVTYRQTGRLYQGALEALLTVGHEVAHANGTVYEAAAECRGAKSTLKLLHHWHATSYQLAVARQLMLHDWERYRPRNQRLVNVNCKL